MTPITFEREIVDHKQLMRFRSFMLEAIEDGLYDQVKFFVDMDHKKGDPDKDEIMDILLSDLMNLEMRFRNE